MVARFWPLVRDETRSWSTSRPPGSQVGLPRKPWERRKLYRVLRVFSLGPRRFLGRGGPPPLATVAQRSGADCAGARGPGTPGDDGGCYDPDSAVTPLGFALLEKDGLAGLQLRGGPREDGASCSPGTTDIPSTSNSYLCTSDAREASVYTTPRSLTWQTRKLPSKEIDRSPLDTVTL